MSDEITLSVYDEKAAEYAALTTDDSTNRFIKPFLESLPKGGRIFELGCGPGKEARTMAQAGFIVDAVDASAEMVKLASVPAEDRLTVRQSSFDEISGVGVYDGVWASFSLLHASKAAFPKHLAALAQILKPHGILYLGMKMGEGEVRDKIGRLYAYYSREELEGHLADAGFELIEAFEGKGKGLSGEVAPYINILNRKRG